MKSLGGAVCHLVVVVHAEADEPDDVALGIAEDELAALVDNGEVEVGEEVTHESGALHAYGTEAVTLTHVAELKGEGHRCGVGTADEGVAALDVTAVKEGDAELGVVVVDVGAGLGDAKAPIILPPKGRQAHTNLPPKGRLFGEEETAGVGDEGVSG